MGVHSMSKLTNKAMVFAIIFGASAGHVFATERDLPDHNKAGCFSCFKMFRKQAINIAQEVRENAPAIEDAATAIISVTKAVAIANGDEKTAKTLDAVQTVLSGAADVANAKDIRSALEISEQIVLTIDPSTAKDIDKLNTVLDALSPQAELILDLAKIAAVNADEKHI